MDRYSSGPKSDINLKRCFFPLSSERCFFKLKSRKDPPTSRKTIRCFNLGSLDDYSIETGPKTTKIKKNIVTPRQSESVCTCF